ncbi:MULTISPECIES: aliphatic sulfonate ABC transporter substrate-binding protein [Microbacterium]|jgi:sulfonate transport system substrate-binding protein|uniref:Putative aliphatic sulfonates-binding protein n=1 Tax=Microbacterium paraoxydans TaxID=199592 RepID=A0A1H1NDS5_9MICO|nr:MULTISPECIES: aliphatic sulfonate ABC transporter substrate-binding protein [Microbacterium]MCK2032039.1 aliphatic sulfonate ABC transporter substrate-binding protein [Microbacterium sp. KSW4-4]SDR96569.1 sulfonate transport system substrate-binding protein [Microbacterium paraoxydans]
MSTITRRIIPAIAVAGTMMLVATGCVAGENASAEAESTPAGNGEWSADTLSIDFATYNPLSLVIRDQGILEDILGDDVTVEWVQSAGSNKANELLRSGSVDVGSTAGSAALLARANGSPIQVIDIFSQPEWSAIVVGPDSDITSVEDLKGASVAATKGTDPYFFLLQALEEGGLSLADVEVQNLQHADGRAALDGGSVDAWAGLDPIMAAAEQESGDKLIYRNVDFNTYGFLNATEDFIDNHPDLAQAVVDAYEEARAWALENPEETAALLAEVAGIDLEVATTVIQERSNLDVNGVPGDDQLAVLEKIAPVLVESGDVQGGQESVDKALSSIINDTFATKAGAGE